jgi:hypothetical protein
VPRSALAWLPISVALDGTVHVFDLPEAGS